MSNPVKDYAGRRLAETFLVPPEQPFPKTPADFGMNYRDEFTPRNGYNWFADHPESMLRWFDTHVGATTR